MRRSKLRPVRGAVARSVTCAYRAFNAPRLSRPLEAALGAAHGPTRASAQGGAETAALALRVHHGGMACALREKHSSQPLDICRCQLFRLVEFCRAMRFLRVRPTFSLRHPLPNGLFVAGGIGQMT